MHGGSNTTLPHLGASHGSGRGLEALTSPGRWARFWATLRARGSDSLPERDRYFVMTGLPRSGTTYLSAVLHYPPWVVTISDPDGAWKRFYAKHGKSRRIFGEFKKYRASILRGKAVPSLEGTAGFRGEKRVDTWNQPKIDQPVHVRPDFFLGMKNPVIFLHHVDLFLGAGLRCLIAVRHPVSVINSWVMSTLKTAGEERRAPRNLANGEAMGFCSNRADPVERRIELHNYLAERILAVKDAPGVRIVRYEDWFTNAAQLQEVCDFAGIPTVGFLRPAPIPPPSIVLDPDERDAILRGCRSFEALGYPCRDGRLVPPQDLSSDGLQA
jgi:hypothetical protein